MEIEYFNYDNTNLNNEMNYYFFDSSINDNEEYFNSESIDYLNDSCSNFNSCSENIFNEEPKPEKIEYIYENIHNLDLDENIVDELYKEINKNLETISFDIKKKNKKHHKHQQHYHHHHHKNNKKDIEQRKKHLKNINIILYDEIKKEIIKKKENYLNVKRKREYL